MKIGLQIPSYTWPGGASAIGPTLARIVQTADELGFASLWVMDHFFQIRGVGQPEEPMLEGYSALSFIAAHTRRARLGTLVSAAVYRHPGVLIKAVSALDVLSGGRATLGIGAGWNEAEAAGLGIPFPPLKERFERLEETLQIALHMWSENLQPYQGKHYRLTQPMNHPQPLSRPHPPILIGGGGEQKTLRLVALYADACNLFARLGEEALRTKLDALKRHCEAAGRPYEAIEKTALDTVRIAPGQMTAAEMVATCKMLSRLGFQHLIVNMPNVSEITPLEAIGREVIPEAANL
jgi:F420-dependent oxidoreductase-like protein